MPYIYFISTINAPTAGIIHTTSLPDLLHALRSPYLYKLQAPSTRPNIQVNKYQHWHMIPYPTNTPPHDYITPPFLPLTHPPKFRPQYYYYIDGSFLPLQDMGDDWTRETAEYGIYNQSKNIAIASRLPGLQNIFRPELMAIYTTFQIITSHYPDEPTHIFTECLNALYKIQTHLKHPINTITTLTRPYFMIS